MSEPREEADIHDGADSGKPNARVIVAVGGKRRDVPCNYEADIVFQDDYEDISTAEMFNQITNKRSYDLFVFIGKEYNFSNEDSLQCMVDYLWRDEMVGIGAIYTDILVKHEGEEICTKYNPAYRASLYHDRIILNIPFIVKSDILPKFNPKIENLQLWDGMLWLIKHSLLLHMPQPLFETNNALDKQAIQKDIELINGTHY